MQSQLSSFIRKVKILVGFCFLFSGLALPARSLTDIKSSGILKVAVDGETPGFNYFKGKHLVGLEVELAEALAKRLGTKIEWTVQPFHSLIIGLQADRFDLIATSHAITPAREAVVDFLNPHYCTGTVIVSRPGGPKSEADLAGKKVVVNTGTVYFDYLAKNKSIKDLRTLPNEAAGFQNLVSGKADAWVTEELVARGAITAHPKDKIVVQDTLFSQKNSMVVGKGNTALEEALNEGLKTTLTDGTFARISTEYFQRDIRCK